MTPQAREKLTPEEARALIDEMVEKRVAAATLDLQNQVVEAKRKWLTSYYQGYDDGISDDPTLKDVEGIRNLTLEQRKVKAAMRYFQSLRTPEVIEKQKVTRKKKSK